MSQALRDAILRAREHLLGEADRGFPEVRHTMRFPRAAGFTAKVDDHVNEGFVRSVLAGLLLDVLELDPDDSGGVRFRESVDEIARQVAQAKQCELGGGWSYFPDLPELPPDLDSLAAAIALFARAAPKSLSLCEGPIALALATIEEDGSRETWLLDPADPPPRLAAMRRGIREYWGGGADVDVCARFYRSLVLVDRQRFADVVRRGASFVAAAQRPDGGWTATWYTGQAYACELCLDLLQSLEAEGEAAARVRRMLLDSQRADGGWGEDRSLPLETALGLRLLTEFPKERMPSAHTQAATIRAMEFLVAAQDPAGIWGATPWIKMDVGRAQKRVIRTLFYGSTTLTTAFCLRSLILFASGADR